MSAVEELLARFQALSASEQAAFLAAVPRPAATTDRPILLTPSEHAPLHSAPSKKDRVTPMEHFKGDIKAAIVEKALAQVKAKKKNTHVKAREDGAFQFPFVEVDQAGTHSRLFRVYPSKGVVTYVIEKKGEERTYYARDLQKMKQVSSKEWVIRFGHKHGDHTRFHPVFPNASCAYQFGYLLRFMKDLVNPMVKEGQEERLSLFIGTWNVGNAPPIVDFSYWIPKDKFDLYVIGAQECEYEPRTGYSSCEEDWRSSISAHIGDKYVLLEHTSMWQIRMLVYVRKELRHNITNIGKSKEATGIGSVLGNKGGVAIGFDFGETSLCFVNSHLAAHQIMVQERNEDVKEIIGNLKIGPREDVSSDFQYVFWCGDLNYRIEGTKAGVEQLVREKKLDVLFANDQLHAEMKKHTVFFGFSEGKLSFRPTYKFDRGTRDEYSQELGRSDFPMRLSDSPLTLERYAAAFEIMTSDHSPVSAAYSLTAIRPFVPASPRTMLVAVYDLHGRHLVALDSNGYSDPYVKFHGPFLVRSRKTSTIHKTRNPNWVSEVVVLQTQVIDATFLARQHLQVVCWDRDTTSTNDLIGSATLSLKGVTDTPSDFHVTLSHRGLPRGTLHGKILVIVDPPASVLEAVRAVKSKK